MDNNISHIDTTNKSLRKMLHMMKTESAGFFKLMEKREHNTDTNISHIDTTNSDCDGDSDANDER